MPVFDAPLEEFYRKLSHQLLDLDAEYYRKDGTDPESLSQELTAIAKHIHALAVRGNVRDATMIKIGNKLSEIANAISRRPDRPLKCREKP
jgi:hypothetical protein